MQIEKALIIGGSGAVGTLFCNLLKNRCTHLTVMDLRSEGVSHIDGVNYVVGDITKRVNTLLLSEVDLIILATPEDPALRALPLIHNTLTNKQCLVDTMSVKSEFIEKLNRLKPSYEAISINPMFGPSLGFQNQSVACIDINRGPISDYFLHLIEKAGGTVIHYDAKAHDQATAATQAATHAAILAFGLTLSKVNYNVDSAKPIWTPPHKTMLCLLARILSSDPEVYRDIQESNPFAKQARESMIEAIMELNIIIENGDREAFHKLFSNLNEILATDKDSLSTKCHEIFKHIT